MMNKKWLNILLSMATALTVVMGCSNEEEKSLDFSNPCDKKNSTSVFASSNATHQTWKMSTIPQTISINRTCSKTT